MTRKSFSKGKQVNNEQNQTPALEDQQVQGELQADEQNQPVVSAPDEQTTSEDTPVETNTQEAPAPTQVQELETAPAPEVAVVSTPTVFKSGSVVKGNEAKLGREATQQVKQAIAQESTAKPVDKSTEFQQRVAKVMAGDNKRERYVATFMESYVKDMAPGVPMSTEEGVRKQKELWRTIKNVVGADEGFKEAFRLLVAYFKEYKDSVFHHHYIHRFYPELDIAPDEAAGLAAMVNLLSVASGVNNKSDVRKLIDFSKTFDKGLNDAARERVYNYFNN